VSPLVLETPPRARRPHDHGTVLPPLPPPPPDGDDGRGPEPRRPRLDNGRLAMIFFLAAETMFFAGLVSAFFVLRLGAAVWPPPLQPRLPVLVTGVNTLVLLASSVAMVGAWRAARAGHHRALVERLAAAASLGVLFLAIQGYEWGRLIHFGLTVTSGAYGATFYTLIGAHGAHVLGALVWLAVTLTMAVRGRFADGRTSVLRACATYWHFVVALWPVLYVTVYLL
jgi:cytochrome c oxidase subunit III